MRLILTFFISLCSLTIYAQTVDISPAKFNCSKEISGVSKDYCTYDLGEHILLVGFNTNNLKAMIKSKKSKDLRFVYDGTTSDAMIIKPKFFESSDKKIIVIMLELAAEYSWGQRIVMIKNDKVYDCGFLDFMTNENNGESIAKYAILRQVNGQVVLTFQPQDFVDKDEAIVKSQTLKYLLTDKGLKQIK
ncbi:MAG TPA: hypothetical protein PLJ84_09690 [Bacteroidales bacterium]|nr:hypothetical protein [Bacteroidales bacterium]